MLNTVPLFAILWLPLAGAAQQLRWGSSAKERSHRVSDAIGVSNGLLVVLTSLALGYTPMFYLMVTSPYPCSTGLSGCGSISCICGNFVTVHGYAWMITTLFGGAVCVMREASSLDGRSRALCAAGACCILFTAIFPEQFTIDPTAPEVMLYDAFMMHEAGLGGAVLLLVFVPYMRVCLATRRMSAGSRCRALLPRTIHILALLAYGVAFLWFRPREPDITDFCAPIATEAACNAWPSLPPTECAALAHMRGSHGAPVPSRYSCEFVNMSLTPMEALLYPPEYVSTHSGVCKKAACLLLKNARSISLEFGMLFLVGAYVTSYTRVDLAWAASVNDGHEGLSNVLGSFAPPPEAEDGGANGVMPLGSLPAHADPSAGLVRNAYGLPWSMPTGVDAR